MRPEARPHITLLGGGWEGKPIWKCEGSGVRGIGTCPCDAYSDWWSHFEKVW